MTSAATAFGPMDEEGIVVFFMMQEGDSSMQDDDSFRCGECGAVGLRNFVIETAP